MEVDFVTSLQCSIKNCFCRASQLIDKSDLAIVVLLSLMWHECQKSCFFGNNCVPCAMCYDKQLGVSTSTPIFLEFACITPSPEHYKECHRKHDIAEKGEHIQKEKRFAVKSVVTHPLSPTLTFFFKSPSVYWSA